MQQWAARLNIEIKLEMDRPRKLLIVINPFGGAKQAFKTWEEVVEPVFKTAGDTISAYFHDINHFLSLL